MIASWPFHGSATGVAGVGWGLADHWLTISISNAKSRPGRKTNFSARESGKTCFASPVRGMMSVRVVASRCGARV